MKIFTLGKGFISDHLPYPKILERIDLFNIGIVLDKYRPDVIINCLSRTGSPNIDWCEKNKLETYIANTTIPLLLAEICQQRNIRLLQLSSGCIFYQQSPNIATDYFDTEKNQFIYNANPPKDFGWRETDHPNPVSFYSKSKSATDLILGNLPNTVCLRLRMPVSPLNHPRNFINKVKNYRQIIDIPNSMTFLTDLVKCISWFANNNLSGIYNVVNPTPLSAVDVMREYQKYRPHEFEIITESQLDQLTVAKRSNCILDGNKLARDGFQMSPTKLILEETMQQYIQNCKDIK